MHRRPVTGLHEPDCSGKVAALLVKLIPAARAGLEAIVNGCSALLIDRL
jgi:hypothetical protein